MLPVIDGCYRGASGVAVAPAVCRTRCAQAGCPASSCAGSCRCSTACWRHGPERRRPRCDRCAESSWRVGVASAHAAGDRRV